MRSRKAASSAVLWIIPILSLISQVTASGVFELKLTSFLNEHGLNYDGNCCNGLRTGGVCSSTCKTFFRVCLTHYQAKISKNPPCSFANITTKVLGNNSINFDSDLAADFINPIQFKFQFSWPGSFSLIIEAWHDSTLHGPVQDSPRELISHLPVQRSAEVSKDWYSLSLKDHYREIKYSYRIVCDKNYYGSGCSEMCRPRDDQFGHYTCSVNGTKVCLDGWTGEYCEQAMCLPGCHPDHGYCDKPNECICRLGWQDRFCDACIPYPGCQHGSCSKPWECNCEEGWGGLFCNQDLNYCTHHKPCKNGGTCTNTGEGSYTCTCPPGFSGTNCEIEYDDCEKQPCLNGGSCKDIGNGFRCMCDKGFYGRSCEHKADSCNKAPCQNQGTCVEGEGSYTCICDAGYSGQNCEMEINECDEKPCLNGGRCIDQRNGFRCLCTTGFEGPTCSENINDCVHNPCQNGGTCVDKVNDYQCRCRPGFVGSLCTDNVDDCLIRPCANGGTCIDMDNTFKCTCADGFAGKDCRINVDDCANSPCRHGGNCTDLVADFKCSCAEGFWGKKCHLYEGMPPLAEPTQITTPTTVETTTEETTVQVTEEDNIPIHGNAKNSSPNSALSNSQLLIVVCLGVGIPLILIIIVVIVLLCKRKNNLMRHNMETEKEQNIVNNINNKCIDSNIFTTIPPNSTGSASIKINNEDKDFAHKKINKKQNILEKSSQKQFIKDYNTHEQLYGCNRDSEREEYEKARKRLDVESLSTDTRKDNSDYSCSSQDIHVIAKPIKRENRNSILVLEQKRHHYSEEVLATEV
ncbi:hypothetical protein SNE40_009243 [Patella caerulea]|uniref:Delta-like protein n=1 Tax=Patella caerulea TaxID=87958 RepID=A0AAN8JUR1_PATCE